MASGGKDGVPTVEWEEAQCTGPTSLCAQGPATQPRPLRSRVERRWDVERRTESRWDVRRKTEESGRKALNEMEHPVTSSQFMAVDRT